MIHVAFWEWHTGTPHLMTYLLNDNLDLQPILQPNSLAWEYFFSISVSLRHSLCLVSPLPLRLLRNQPGAMQMLLFVFLTKPIVLLLQLASHLTTMYLTT